MLCILKNGKKEANQLLILFNKSMLCLLFPTFLSFFGCISRSFFDQKVIEMLTRLVLKDNILFYKPTEKFQ
jgi:hypothetical protein